MNLEDEMAFVLGVVEPEKSSKVNMKEAFPNASGCNMKSSYQVTSKETKELSEMFKAQEEILGIPSGKSSQTENKVSSKKRRSKFLKESGSVHDKVVSMCKGLDRGELKEIINSLMEIM